MSKTHYSIFTNPLLQSYFNSIEKYPLLERSKEIELANKVKNGDSKARELFINSNLRLVIYIAKQYIDSKLPFEDVISAGNLGLIKAVDKFDPSFNVQFSLYAPYWIRNSIFNTMYVNSTMIKVPAVEWYRKKKLEKLIENCSSESINLEELSNKLKLSIKQIKEIQSIPECDFSLDFPRIEGGENRIYSIESNEKNPEEEYLDKNISEFIYKEIDRLLSDREKDILYHRLGLNDDTSSTLKEIGKEMGFSKQRIQQIEKKALQKLLPLAKSLLN